MEIVCRRRSNCRKEPWFGKPSSFACLMGYFPGSCSGAIKSSIPRCICLVRVAQTVLVWQFSDLDSEVATRGVLSKRVFCFCWFPKASEFTLQWVAFYGHMLSSAVSVIFRWCLLLTSIFTGFKSRWAIPLLWRRWSEQSNVNLFSERE